MKKMLINATQQEELRVALVEGENLYDLDIENIGGEQTKANIYKGKIAKCAPSLDAVFIDYGEEKHGFLPLKEISPYAFLQESGQSLDVPVGSAKIKSFLKEGQELLVQISKSERGTKGAALTTFISLAGSYLVLMPNNRKTNGISRRIEGVERQTLKQHLEQLNVPEDMGLIVRTAGVCKSKEDLEWDLNNLINYWRAIGDIAQRYPAPCLIHQEGSILSRAIRDYVKKDIEEILVDDLKTYEIVKDRISLFKPEFINKIHLYSGPIPLFQTYKIESQIETAFQREVRLPSGGSIVIDSTEALTAIDVNSARSTKGLNIEETAYLTNLEAAQEISRQFRLRDLGGLIVIDFIDMQQAKHQQVLEARMREFLKDDRARVQISSLSRFGLLELSRQRLGLSLGELSTHCCPRCYGRGTVRSNESLALAILRLLEDAATHPKDSAQILCAVVPVNIGSYLLNEKRASLVRIEKNYQIKILVVPDETLQTPDYFIHQLSNEVGLAQFSYLLPGALSKMSYKNQCGLDSKPSIDSTIKNASALLTSEINTRVRRDNQNDHPGLLKRFWNWMFLDTKTKNAVSTTALQTSMNDSNFSSNNFCSSSKSTVEKIDISVSENNVSHEGLANKKALRGQSNRDTRSSSKKLKDEVKNVSVSHKKKSVLGLKIQDDLPNSYPVPKNFVLKKEDTTSVEGETDNSRSKKNLRAHLHQNSLLREQDRENKIGDSSEKLNVDKIQEEALSKKGNVAQEKTTVFTLTDHLSADKINNEETIHTKEKHFSEKNTASEQRKSEPRKTNVTGKRNSAGSKKTIKVVGLNEAPKDQQIEVDQLLSDRKDSSQIMDKSDRRDENLKTHPIQEKKKTEHKINESTSFEKDNLAEKIIENKGNGVLAGKKMVSVSSQNCPVNQMPLNRSTHTLKTSVTQNIERQFEVEGIFMQNRKRHFQTKENQVDLHKNESQSGVSQL